MTIKNEDILDAFVWNFDKYPENPCYSVNLMTEIRKVMNEELPKIFPLRELDEIQWELLQNRILKIVEHEIMLIKVEYLPKNE